MSYSVEPKDRYFQIICSFPNEIKTESAVIFSSQVDLVEVENLRARSLDMFGHKISYTAVVIRALAMALKENPYANRRVFCWPGLSLFGPRLQRFHNVDITVAAERSLPGRESVAFFDVLRDADRLSLLEIHTWLKALAASDLETNKQWRTFCRITESFPYWMSSRILRMPYWFPSMWAKYRGGAAMVNSPSKYGVENMAGTWVHPLVVGFGLVAPRPVVVDGQVVAHPTFNLMMNFDRRVMAGAKSAQFFKRIVDILEHASTELIPFLG